ncbi:unnamed protein product [Schistocephalus solidus]|uniref:Integrase catalytic domain-containing protein n=1 Tax=Schistocephalus solidus TaxID=70667 RepID=A0A183TQX2_SCHSO|nr:unnamed protein product [Schistocephalus solidus]
MAGSLPNGTHDNWSHNQQSSATVKQVCLSRNDGEQLKSAAFVRFCKWSGITHLRSPQLHSQCKEQFERFVDMFKRALQKSKGEETTEEVLEIFLLTYQATPNTYASHGVSPAEASMQRKLCTPVDVIRPLSPVSVSDETAHPTPMQRQFNQRHVAKQRLFRLGETVLAKTYRKNQEQWTLGRVYRKCGDVFCEIRVGSDIRVRHANQLKHTKYATSRYATEWEMSNGSSKAGWTYRFPEQRREPNAIILFPIATEKTDVPVPQ